VTRRFFGAGAVGPRAIAWWYARREVRPVAEGIEHVPVAGPAVIAARHYHHLHDGVALVTLLPRHPYLCVALDWTRTPLERRVMEAVCDAAEWPVVLRPDNLAPRFAPRAFSAAEVPRYTRRAIELAARLLARGEQLVVFPEGYPTYDVDGPRRDDTLVVPFKAGLLAMIARGERLARRAIPVVPTGLRYRGDAATGYDVTVRFGAPLYAGGRPRSDVLTELGTRVAQLSA